MGLDERRAAERSYVLISAAELFSGFYAPFQFAAEHRTRLGGWRILSLCECDHTLTQLTDRSFEVKLDGSLLDSPFAAVLRSPRHAPKVGDRVELTDMAIEVRGIDDQAQPNRFSVELKSPTLPEFWAWSDGKMERFRAPTRTLSNVSLGTTLTRPAEQRRASTGVNAYVKFDAEGVAQWVLVTVERVGVTEITLVRQGAVGKCTQNVSQKSGTGGKSTCEKVVVCRERLSVRSCRARREARARSRSESRAMIQELPWA